MWVFFYSAKSHEISKIFGWENRATESLNWMQVLITSVWVVQKAKVSDSKTCMLSDLTPSHLDLIWNGHRRVEYQEFWSMECQTPYKSFKDFWNITPVILSAMRPRWLDSTHGRRELSAPSESYSCLSVVWRWWCLNSSLLVLSQVF